MRKAIALFGVIGLVGCFLPMVAGLSWFGFREFDSVVYLVMAGFLIPAIAAFTDKTAVAATIGTLGFGYILAKFRLSTLDLFVDGSIGGKLMAVAAVAGFICSLCAFAEAKQRR